MGWKPAGGATDVQMLKARERVNREEKERPYANKKRVACILHRLKHLNEGQVDRGVIVGGLSPDHPVKFRAI